MAGYQKFLKSFKISISWEIMISWLLKVSIISSNYHLHVNILFVFQTNLWNKTAFSRPTKTQVVARENQTCVSAFLWCFSSPNPASLSEFPLWFFGYRGSWWLITSFLLKKIMWFVVVYHNFSPFPRCLFILNILIFSSIKNLFHLCQGLPGLLFSKSSPL